jgi:hypothetical protein
MLEIDKYNITKSPMPPGLSSAERAPLAQRSCFGKLDVDCQPYCSKPNTATPVCVPTYTLPLVMIGVMNLLPLPN